MGVAIAIIGAGFSGISAALRLLKEGFDDFTIFERSSASGGTWRENIYPGCRCDIKSFLYCFKDHLDFDWTEQFPLHEEIFRYIEQTCRKYKLHDKIRFNSKVKCVKFDEVSGRWKVNVDDIISYFDFVIVATGPLTNSKIPDFDGKETFSGFSFHSSEWGKTSDLADKKIAVIGTGASAIQIIPELQKVAEKLVVFQRTAAWIMPKFNKKYSRRRKLFYRMFPAIINLIRTFEFWKLEIIGLAFLHLKLPRAVLRFYSMAYISLKVRNRAVRRKLIPNYAVGCKRILLSNHYLNVFNADNVELNTDQIIKFSEHGIVTENDYKKFDVIIYATGFTVAVPKLNCEIYGIQDKSLGTTWDQNFASAYKGTFVSGFPNLAILLGPNTGLAHNSVLHMVESQCNQIIKVLKIIESDSRKISLNVNEKSQEDYNRYIQKKNSASVFSSGCRSWYMTDNGLNTVIFPGTATRFRILLKTLDLKSFDIKIHG